MSGALDRLTSQIDQAQRSAAAPVHLWDPPYCGDLDLRIAADGAWHYLGTPIGRPALVRLFASVLKRQGDAYFLVTPVEKIGIRVDDTPFLAVEMRVQNEGGGRALDFRTNVDEWIACGPGHALQFARGAHDGLVPRLHVRHDEPNGLWARVSRAVYYDLMALGEIRTWCGEDMFGIVSRGQFFPACAAQEAMAQDTMAQDGRAQEGTAKG